jgi:hypothetical protein
MKGHVYVFCNTYYLTTMMRFVKIPLPVVRCSSELVGALNGEDIVSYGMRTALASKWTFLTADNL